MNGKCKLGEVKYNKSFYSKFEKIRFKFSVKGCWQGAQN